ASLHHRWKRLWSAFVYAGCARLVDACYYSRRAVRIRDLVDCSHPASGKLAKAVRCRSSPFNSSAACEGMSAMIAASLFELRLSLIVLVGLLTPALSALSASSAPETVVSSALSLRAQVTIENWD